MDYGFGLYRIQPTQGADHAGGDPKDLGRAERSYTYAEAYAATGSFDKGSSSTSKPGITPGVRPAM